MKRWFVFSFFFLAGLLMCSEAGATHLRAGQITIKRQGCTNIFEITLIVFLDTEGVEFGGSYVFDLGDNTFETLDRGKIVETVIDQNLHVGKVTYKLFHTYAPGKYVVSYREQNRNANVLNMDSSVSTTFYIETTITIDPALESILGCNSTPVLLIDPIDRGCTGVKFEHNPGAVDPDGDSLSYELVVPFQSKGTQVINYRDPNNPQFYTALNYNQANEEGNGPPTFSIDNSGTITWDAPGAAGEYNIAFLVKEWRHRNGRWYQLGFVRRDMQIIVADCNNMRPRLEIPQDTCVVAGTLLETVIKGFDDLASPPEHHPVKIEAFSDVFGFATNPATYSPNPPEFKSSNPFAELNFRWNITCEHVKDQPYQVVFKITDNPPLGPKLVSFATWRIRVVAPAPEWVSATADVVNRKATLQWQPYECAPTVPNIKIQVWRKVDGAPFTPDNCETGIPPSLGFTLIKELDADKTTYEDKGLSVGARYCYRLVAVFPLPTGGESYVSDEICVDPILADAPVITKVSVAQTGKTDGIIDLAWLEPFDIDPAQFPPPYEYVVQRSESLTGFQSGLVHPGRLSVLSTTDNNLNTEDKTYYYRILLYVPTVSATTAIDTSAIASTVRLELVPQATEIDLQWGAFVPWSNQIQASPEHDVYRGPTGAKINSDLTFLSKVNVFVDGQLYTDPGPFVSNTLYCYQVQTYGGYGNPNITEPLLNYSQIICGSTRDDVPPCNTSLAIELTDCTNLQTQACDLAEYQNSLSWERPTGDCSNDIKSYRIYVSNVLTGEYVLLTETTETTFVDKNLTSFARCYRISTVDRSGNESELSDPVCNENCPYYELPNMFSPNGDNFNETFGAFSLRRCEIEGNCTPTEIADLTSRCARFVEKVNFKVFNRWGREVYTFESGGEGKTIYIDWDGRDKLGRELSVGIYYYSAEVFFLAANPANRVKTYKGWIHLMR